MVEVRRPMPDSVTSPDECDAGCAPSPMQAVAVIVVLSIPFIFLDLGRYSVVNGDEAIYQQMALRMLDSGQWFRLMSGNEHRVYDTFMNAPIQYWVRAAIATWIGPELWAMRIHSALLGLGTVLLLYRVVHWVAGRRAAFLAALIQLTTFQFLFLHGARTGELETALCFLFVMCAYLFMRAGEDPGRGFWLHHLGLALILSLKLPVILIPLGAELAAFALSARARRRLVHWFATGIAVAPVALAWHIHQAIHLREEFLHVISRMADQATTMQLGGQKRGGWDNLRRYFPVVCFGTFPYVLGYPFGIVDALRRWWVGEEDAARDRLLVLLLFPMAVIVFYALVAKRGAWYPMPAYPFLSALLGIWLARLPLRRVGDVQLAGFAILCSLLVWLAPQIRDFNPFATAALHIAMPMHWRDPGWLAPILGAPLLAGFLLIGLRFARERMGDRFQARVATLLAASFILYAVARATVPLQFLDHESDYGRLRREIDAKQREGIELPYPLHAPAGQAWIVRYYFWQDFALRLGERDPETRILLDARAGYLLYERKQMRERGLQPPPRRPAR